MPECLIIARWFLLGGGALAAIGLVLWIALPISSMFPPYLVTALLALGYGEFCRRRERSVHVGKS
jgi:hypothetical protein